MRENKKLTLNHHSILSGDRLLATEAASQQWGQPQDVRLNLNYPKTGYAEVITYFEVVADQVKYQFFGIFGINLDVMKI